MADSGGGEPDEDSKDLRRTAENLNFNLSSVLQNPRTPVSKSLYDELASFDPFSFSMSFKEEVEKELRAKDESSLPEVTIDHFREYLSVHSELCEKFERNQPNRSSKEGVINVHDREANNEAALRMAANSGVSLFPGAIPTPQQVYAEVPPLFQKQSFTLSNPEIFEKVVLLAPKDRQEQLSHYLDLVEVCLLQQISERQDSFFMALENLQELRNDVAIGCRSVATLRGNIKELQRNMVSGTMKVPQLARRKENLASMQQQLDAVQQVYDAYQAVEGYFKSRDFGTALLFIKRAQRKIKQDLSEVKCLTSISKKLVEYELKAAEYLADQFVSESIADDLSLDVLSVEQLLAQSESGGSSSSSQSGIDSSITSSSTSTKSGGVEKLLEPVNPNQRIRLAQLVRALVRIGEIKPALEKYGRRLEKNIEDITRATVAEYVNADHSTGGVGGVGMSPSSSLDKIATAKENTQRMAKLDERTFRNCLGSTCDAMVDAIGRAAAVNALIKHTLDEAKKGLTDASVPGESNGNAVNGGAEAQVEKSGTGGGVMGDNAFLGIADTENSFQTDTPLASNDFPANGPTPDDLNAKSLRNLTESCKLAQKTVSLLLRSREEAHKKLSIEALKDLQSASHEFLQVLEKFSGRSCYDLRATQKLQAKAFLEHQQEDFMQNLAAALDSEKWSQASVSPERQATLDRLTSGQAFLPGKLGSASGFIMTASTAKKKGSKKETNDAVVEGTKYKVVWSCLLLIQMIESLFATVAYFPVLSTDVLQRLVDLLRLFNTRATDLILHAGAIRRGTLPKITAKHLALTSQCLGLIMAVLPHVRAALAAQLPQREHLLLTEIDRVKTGIVIFHYHAACCTQYAADALIFYALSWMFSRIRFGRPSRAHINQICRYCRRNNCFSCQKCE